MDVCGGRSRKTAGDRRHFRVGDCQRAGTADGAIAAEDPGIPLVAGSHFSRPRRTGCLVRAALGAVRPSRRVVLRAALDIADIRGDRRDSGDVLPVVPVHGAAARTTNLSCLLFTVPRSCAPLLLLSCFGTAGICGDCIYRGRDPSRGPGETPTMVMRCAGSSVAVCRGSASGVLKCWLISGSEPTLTHLHPRHDRDTQPFTAEGFALVLLRRGRYPRLAHLRVIAHLQCHRSRGPNVHPSRLCWPG